MGYAFMVGPCFLCKRPFTFNPLKVPSMRVEGVREPICRTCHKAANQIRIDNGLAPWPEPHPDAYLVCDENELP